MVVSSASVFASICSPRISDALINARKQEGKKALTTTGVDDEASFYTCQGVIIRTFMILRIHLYQGTHTLYKGEKKLH